jgi:hypothetical protein
LPGLRRKHVPLRTCIACQQERAKRELVRIVRTGEGTIEIDPKGKRSGRGAYVCYERACWDAALRQGKLGHALKCQVSTEQVAALRAGIELLAAARVAETAAAGDAVCPEGRGVEGRIYGTNE